MVGNYFLRRTQRLAVAITFFSVCITHSYGQSDSKTECDWDGVKDIEDTFFDALEGPPLYQRPVPICKNGKLIKNECTTFAPGHGYGWLSNKPLSPFFETPTKNDCTVDDLSMVCLREGSYLIFSHHKLLHYGDQAYRFQGQAGPYAIEPFEGGTWTGWKFYLMKYRPDISGLGKYPVCGGSCVRDKEKCVAKQSRPEAQESNGDSPVTKPFFPAVQEVVFPGPSHAPHK